MHEEALLRDLRRKLIEVTQGANGAPVRFVRVWVGALSHVSAESLQGRWPEVVAGTPAQGARLEVDVSSDPEDPAAQGVRLVELTVEEPGDGPAGRRPSSSS
jgi:hydrogenase nickel incorporation protein HypA/HybF